jgi:hypothetical protein
LVWSIECIVLIDGDFFTKARCHDFGLHALKSYLIKTKKSQGRIHAVVVEQALWRHLPV